MANDHSSTVANKSHESLYNMVVADMRRRAEKRELMLMQKTILSYHYFIIVPMPKIIAEAYLE
jgi:hypothetical protein